MKSKKNEVVLDLVVTTIKEKTFVDPPDGRSGVINNVELVVISIDLFKEIVYGPTFLGPCNMQTSYDLTDAIHSKMYCPRVLQLDPLSDDSAEEKIWMDKEMTRYCNSMSAPYYYKLLILMLKQHSAQFNMKASDNKEGNYSKHLKTSINKAVALMISRLTAILNNGLYLKDRGEELPLSFNIDSNPGMRIKLS